MKLKLGIVTTLLIFALTGSVFSADVAKIGIVDFQKILAVSEGGKKVSEILKSEVQLRKKQLMGKQKELQAKKEQMEREALVVSDEAKRKKMIDYQKMVYQLKQLNVKFNRAIQNLNNKNTRIIEIEIQKIVKKIGKQEGFLLIVGKAQAGVLYAPKQIDITDKVIKKYNAVFAKQKAAAAKKAKSN
ncbi:MAG: OmpH family outer membrane protein [Desulfobacterales bacterium]|nr:OmpH family outer membrane protein [Desulfobacterales bacterium]MCP4160951.1 OmpH family outer membrane protein [Deltaproteobacteria bacterium]